jgi:hypothetical protein
MLLALHLGPRGTCGGTDGGAAEPTTCSRGVTLSARSRLLPDRLTFRHVLVHLSLALSCAGLNARLLLGERRRRSERRNQK